MDRAGWVWMPHAAHFIMASWCRFHLATFVGHVVVSTVGELVPDDGIREIEATSRGIVLQGRGDARLADWLDRCGYSQLGYGRIYETMVFTAVNEGTDTCCPWRADDGRDIDMRGYNDATEAYRGHLALCEKWSGRSAKEGK